MPKYMVVGKITISMSTDVVADSEEQAIELAQARGIMGLCHQCASSQRSGSEWVTSGELDGGDVEPVNDDGTFEVTELDE